MPHSPRSITGPKSPVDKSDTERGDKSNSRNREHPGANPGEAWLTKSITRRQIGEMLKTGKAAAGDAPTDLPAPDKPSHQRQGGGGKKDFIIPLVPTAALTIWVCTAIPTEAIPLFFMLGFPFIIIAYGIFYGFVCLFKDPPNPGDVASWFTDHF